MANYPKYMQRFRIKNVAIKQGLAEFLGTYLLIIIGDGSVAQYVLSGKEASFYNFLAVNIAWGIGVAAGVFASAGISGGHLNPAVSLAQALIGRLPWRRLPVYMISQYLGAFTASAVLYFTYYDALDAYDGGTRQVIGAKATAGIWATYPQGYLSWWNGLFDQIVATQVLLLGVMALTDDKNSAPSPGVVPFGVGMIVLCIGTSFGFNCGYAINPARDLAPRFFTAIAGWGWDTFSVYDYYFWIPIVGPHLGAILGAFTYLLLVEVHHESEDITDQTSYELKEGSKNLAFVEESNSNNYM